MQNIGLSGIKSNIDLSQYIKKVEYPKDKKEEKKYEYTTDNLDLTFNKDVPLPNINGIPSSSVLEIDMRKPWSQKDKDAVQIPQYNVCRTSIDGLQFCGIPSSNSFTVFNF